MISSHALVAVGVLAIQAIAAQQHDVPYSTTRSLRGDSIQPATNITLEYTNTPPIVAVININDESEFQLYANEYDILEASAETMTITALVNDDDLTQFDAEGVSYTIDEATTAELEEATNVVQQPSSIEEGEALEKADGTLMTFRGISGYSCYRTVEETYATAELIEATYPDIAEWIDIGPSWDRTQNNGKAGYRMKVLKLTNKAANTNIKKPILFATCSIHAREYAPAELCTRFAEKLVQGYGSDADVTTLIDQQEIHLILQANPDGRKMAEAGQMWRKNTNNRSCGRNYGVDLNRNWPYGWGGEGASSSCTSETYRGSSAGSEIEMKNIMNYIDSLGWGNQRNIPESYYNSMNICRRGTYCPSSQQYPAPSTATGIALDIHAYGELMLWPWGYTKDKSGNDSEYIALGRKLAHYNGYKPQQSTSLYVTAGTTGDTWYGKYGAASLCYELGTSFFQSCSGSSGFVNKVLPDNILSLLYAAKSSRLPYKLPFGPDVSISGGNIVAKAGDLVTINAEVDDTRYNQGNSNNEPTQPTQNIASAALFVDSAPWDSIWETGFQMKAADNSFDSKREAVQYTLDTTGLSPGRHTIYIVGKDTSFNEGVFSAVFLDIEGTEKPTPKPTLSPSTSPSHEPSRDPSSSPTQATSKSPSDTDQPTSSPIQTEAPSPKPSLSPSSSPTNDVSCWIICDVLS